MINFNEKISKEGYVLLIIAFISGLISGLLL